MIKMDDNIKKNSFIEDEINFLKQKRKAVILAHYYQDEDIQDIADFVGDSLDLSKKAAEELGFIKNGVAKVRVEILEDESRKYVSTNQKNNYVAEAAEVTQISKKNLLSSSERKEKVVE